MVAVAVRERDADDRAGRERDELLGGVHRRVDLQPPRTRDVPLTGVACTAATAGVLVLAAHVEDDERRIVEPRGQLLPRRERAGVRLERGLAHGLELDLPRDDLTRPACDPAEK